LQAIHDGCGGAACGETFCSEVSLCLALSHRGRPGQPRHTGASNMCSVVFYAIGVVGKCRGQSCDSSKGGLRNAKAAGFSLPMPESGSALNLKSAAGHCQPQWGIADPGDAPYGSVKLGTVADFSSPATTSFSQENE
jgi:hypothetical protein